MKKKGENDPQLGLDVTQVFLSQGEIYSSLTQQTHWGSLKKTKKNFLFLENFGINFPCFFLFSFLHRLPEKLNCIVIWFI